MENITQVVALIRQRAAIKMQIMNTVRPAPSLQWLVNRSALTHVMAPPLKVTP
jgi:hypothetical protein